jgi:predicted flap endonuclease-1-like 5' DNA nuclease
VNDGSAVQYIHDERFQVENCVIEVPAGKEAAVAVSVTKEKAPKAKAAPAVKEAKVKETKSVKNETDDLSKVEGIGKKIVEILAAEQIISFQDLAKATPKKIKTILDAAGNKFKMHDPATWPKQAKLAAAGKWDELKKLQEELNGGK